MNKQSQQERILKYLNAKETITAQEAFSLLGISQFHTRLKELKAKGYKFNQEMIKTKSVYGDTVKFNKYSLEA